MRAQKRPDHGAGVTMDLDVLGLSANPVDAGGVEPALARMPGQMVWAQLLVSVKVVDRIEGI